MIPKPPFLKDLTPEQEIAEFQRLKPRLAEVWDALIMREEEPHTSVVVPSLTLDQSELRKIAGRELLRGAAAVPPHPPAQPAGADGVRHLAARPPDHPRVLPAVPGRDPGEPRALAAHAALRGRRLAALADREDPRAAAPHREDPRRDPRTRRSALPDGLQLDAARAQARRPARHPAERLRPAARPPRHEVGQPQGLPRGGGGPAAGLRGPAHAARGRGGARRRCARSGPASARAVVKLNDSFSGEGNALFRYPESQLARTPSSEALRQVEFSVRGGDARGLLRQVLAAWAASSRSSSRRRRSTRRARSCGSAPRGDVLPISTHDQILGGPSGQVFLGCRFPARDDYRMRIQEAGQRIGAALAATAS